MSDLAERLLKKKIEDDARDVMKKSMPYLQKGEVPPDSMKQEDVSNLGQFVKDQADAKKLVEKTGQVEMNTGQLRNVGEGPMVLRTEEPSVPKVDAVTGAAPVVTGNGGKAAPVTGSIPMPEKPQIDVNGPPPDYRELETPDMRAKDGGPAIEQAKTSAQKAVEGLEKEEGPGFWDVLEAGLSGWNGKESAWSKKQGEKRKQKNEMAQMEQQAALQKANQLELMAKQAEIAGKMDEAQALRQESAAQRRYQEQLGLLEKEYGLKKGSNTDLFLQLAEKFMGGGK
jgi:hypothetical protein